MADYLSHHQKEHIWKHLTPTSPAPSPFADPVLKCKAQFHLIDPLPSTSTSIPSWHAYFEQRTRADTAFKGMLEQYAGEELDPLLDQIKAGFEDTLESIPGLDEAQRNVIADGLVPFRFETYDNYGDVRLLSDSPYPHSMFTHYVHR